MNFLIDHNIEGQALILLGTITNREGFLFHRIEEITKPIPNLN
jgi:hypothetical protein